MALFSLVVGNIYLLLIFLSLLASWNFGMTEVHLCFPVLLGNQFTDFYRMVGETHQNRRFWETLVIERNFNPNPFWEIETSWSCHLSIRKNIKLNKFKDQFWTSLSNLLFFCHHSYWVVYICVILEKACRIVFICPSSYPPCLIDHQVLLILFSECLCTFFKTLYKLLNLTFYI